MTNYRRGYEIERKIMNMLRDDGYIAFRSAGSHSLIDIFGIKGDKIRLIQSKRVKKYHKSMFAKEIDELKGIKSPSCCSKELWVWEDKYGWVLTVVL